MITHQTTSLLETWLESRLPATQWVWLQQRLELVKNTGKARDLVISFGLIPRKLGHDSLQLTNQEIASANTARTAWDPTSWTIDSAARTLLLCEIAKSDNEKFTTAFKDLCQTAELRESICLYRGIVLYPPSVALDTQIGVGLRSNIKAVFEAIAHYNPYPAEHFDELRWNHMVLKALFIDSTLRPIVDLDSRTNAELARILCDYAHERWAAGRHVKPELWRCVGPYATPAMLDDLSKVIQSDLTEERQAGLLALAASSAPAARSMLDTFPTERSAIADGSLTWDSLGVDTQT